MGDVAQGDHDPGRFLREAEPIVAINPKDTEFVDWERERLALKAHLEVFILQTLSSRAEGLGDACLDS